MIYANSVAKLKEKVRENNGIWYIFDLKKLEEAQTSPKGNKIKRKYRKNLQRKISTEKSEKNSRMNSS